MTNKFLQRVNPSVFQYPSCTLGLCHSVVCRACKVNTGISQWDKDFFEHTPRAGVLPAAPLLRPPSGRARPHGSLHRDWRRAAWFSCKTDNSSSRLQMRHRNVNLFAHVQRSYT
eukprot:2291440-Rhodomonas_salina.1